MKRNIQKPEIALKLSQQAYLQAAKEFNEKQTKLFNSGKTEAKTLNSLLLKDTHHQVFYAIVKFYREKIHNLSQLFNGSSNIMTYISPQMSMHVKTGRIAYYLGRQNHTIRERLRRLEKAGIIKVVFHGHKRPLEIIFDKETCLVIDKDNLEEKPKSKFLKDTQSVYSTINSKKPNNIEGTISGTSIYNITITSNAFQNENLGLEQSIEALKCDLKNTKKIAGTTLAGTTKTDNTKTSKSESTHQEEKERKKVPQKKERKGRTIKEIREAKYKELREKAAYRQMSEAERIQHSAKKKASYKTDRSNELKKRKKDALIHYSLEFYGYLIDALFSNKYFSPHYRIEVQNYISKHYFSHAKSKAEMERLLKNYKIRVDISKKWIANFTNGADGRSFDTTYFFPKAYLDIEKTHSKAFSFANTKKFIKNNENWNKINGYKRKADNKQRHKFNKIARELENGFINYDTALVKVKSLTNKNDEYIKQLNARCFGMYKNMNV